MLNPYSNYMACLHPLHSLFSSLASSSLPCIYLFRNLLVRHTVSWRNGWLFLQSSNRVWANQIFKILQCSEYGLSLKSQPHLAPPNQRMWSIPHLERTGRIDCLSQRKTSYRVNSWQGLAWPLPTWRLEYQYLHFTRLTLPIGFKEEIDEEVITYQVTDTHQKSWHSVDDACWVTLNRSSCESWTQR